MTDAQIAAIVGCVLLGLLLCCAILGWCAWQLACGLRSWELWP